MFRIELFIPGRRSQIVGVRTSINPKEQALEVAAEQYDMEGRPFWMPLDPSSELFSEAVAHYTALVVKDSKRKEGDCGCGKKKT
jgi:hypothetical protein